MKCAKIGDLSLTIEKRFRIFDKYSLFTFVEDIVRECFCVFRNFFEKKVGHHEFKLFVSENRSGTDLFAFRSVNFDVHSLVSTKNGRILHST